MNKRQKLARIAKQEASKFYHGYVMTMKPNFQPIISIFPKWPLKKWDNHWCAAFVYFCCRKAVFNISVKYPDSKVPCNFAGCYAWEKWA